MGKGDFLGEFEQIVLLAILRLGANAYGVRIRQEISHRIERDVSIGSVYTTLGRLEQKGYIRSWVGESTPQRGGRAKKFFKLSAKGQLALEQSFVALSKMSEGMKNSVTAEA